MNKPCRHKFRTVRVEDEVIDHPRFGKCRREHRQCQLCPETRIDHLLVDTGLEKFFSLGTS